jgi:hypothetical protein
MPTEVKNSVGYRRETWKRFLQTIISQLPTWMAKYSSTEQAYLNEFLTTIQMCEVNTHMARTTLTNRFRELIEKYRHSEEYYRLPFLWFVVTYFTRANQLLGIAKFHADVFYEYLVQFLRGDTQIDGVFQLVKKETALDNLAWEQLQYACSKLIVPLTNEELQIFQTIYSSIPELEIQALNQRIVKRTIVNEVRSPKVSRDLQHFFTMLDATWYLRFRMTALGLKIMYFQFQRDKDISLTEIINFQNPNNTTLGASQVYQIRGQPDTYIGAMLIPDQLKTQLQEYLEELKQQGKLIFTEMDEIKENHVSCSVNLYRAGLGWRKITETDWRQYSKLLKTTQPRKRRTKSPPFFLTPTFNQEWHYQQHSEPSQVIELCCTGASAFSFENLPIGGSHNKIISHFSKREVNLLQDLHRKKIVHVGFHSDRLAYEFSLDSYWITLPFMSRDQLSRLLVWLPYAQILVSETKIHLWTVLTTKLKKWLKEDLKWKIEEVIPVHRRLTRSKNWYNFKEEEWKTPQALER